MSETQSEAVTDDVRQDIETIRDFLCDAENFELIDDDTVDTSDAARALARIEAALCASPAGTASREQVAKVLATIFHGDAVEWRGFLSKADAFLAFPWSAFTATDGQRHDGGPT